ncbi:MAG: hypothetical protein OEY51_09885, partial [Cyclobacteriaceae bacterium]|nr:hypothetical protein [Cyclobacteriaceae bacterium]
MKWGAVSYTLSKSPAEQVLALLSLLTGWCFYQTQLFVNHFYERPLTDLLILSLIFLIVITIRLVTAREDKMTGSLFSIPLYTVVSLYSTFISWHIFSYTEFSYVPVYLSVGFMAFMLGGYLHERRKIRVMILSSFVAAGFLIALLSNYYLFGLVVVGFLLLLFRIFPNVVRSSLIPSLIILLAFPLLPEKISWYERQQKYYDKVIFSEETRFQAVDVTEWKGHFWYYYNGKNQFSSIDHSMFYEPLVQPALSLVKDPGKVLVLGGENGLAL